MITPQPERRSIRLPNYDYSSPGFYFVTLCLLDKQQKMGALKKQDIQLNKIGCIVKDSWQWLKERYPYVRLDEYIIMPDHLHGIISIIGTDFKDDAQSNRFNNVKPLGNLIGAFKTTSTKKINQYLHTPGKRFWQRNYYERVIRDNKELDEIRFYIRFNPDKTNFL